MKKFKIFTEEVMKKEYTIEANNKEEAKEKFLELHKKNELDADDLYSDGGEKIVSIRGLKDN